MSAIDKMNDKEMREKFEKMLKREESAKKTAERVRVRGQLLIQKAKQAGLTVSDEEIDEYIKNMKK